MRTSNPTPFEVTPRVGAGAAKLGMGRSDARRLLGEPTRSYAKASGETLTDTYFGSALQLGYDHEDRLEYIELNGPASVDAVFQGRSLLFTPADEVLEWMQRFAQYDPDGPELGYSYYFPDLDMALWRPVLPTDADEEGRYFRSIGIGRVGYYAKVGPSDVRAG